ncbi:MAG: cation-efflux pump [Candidatus Thorarchaeota archaeon]|nr:cation-efflux pump [Candidatus Thorarchaeota archaeon]
MTRPHRVDAMTGSLDRSDVVRAAALSVVAALGLTLMKLVVGVFSGSLGVLSEALHSGLDLIAAGVTFVAVKAAAKAPDEDHLYGHGKVESFAALAETIMLWVTSIWIIYEAIRRILFAELPEPTIWGVVVMSLSIVIDYERSRMLYRTAEKHGSQALEADALHFSTDMISSAVVLLGLGFVWLGFPIGDPLAALGVSIVIIYVSLNLGKRAYDELVDTAPEGMSEQVKQICLKTPGVIEVGRIRIRGSVTTMFVDVVVKVDDSEIVAHAHEIASQIENEVATLAQKVDVVVHIEPADAQVDDKDIYSIMQRIARTIPEIENLHNVLVHTTDDGIHVAAHLEMDDSLTLSEAHAVSESFERQIREKIEGLQSVTLHLESATEEEVGTDITEQVPDIVQAIHETLNSMEQVDHCREVMVNRDDKGITVLLTCCLTRDMTLLESHAIADLIEQCVMERLPQIRSVVVHLEPDSY